MNFYRLTLGLFLALWLTPHHGQAAPADKNSKVQDMTPQTVEMSQSDDIPLLDTEQQKKLDDIKTKASDRLVEAAEWIDSFFDDGRSTMEDNETRATVKLSTGYSRNDNFEVKPRFSLRLKLPRLSSRALLIIQAAEDDDFDTESSPVSNPSTSHDNSKYNDITVGLRHFLKEADKYNVSVDGGASWSYLYAGIRFRALNDLGSWQGRLTSRLRYYTDDGWEFPTSYDIETYWGKNWMFRTTSSVVLSEDEKGIPYSQYFRLFQVLSEFQAISYESGVFFDTEPTNQVTDVQFLVKYRQRFYRDWLVLEIAPRVTFPEDHDYDVNPGIHIKFEAMIGYDTDKETYKSIFR